MGQQPSFQYMDGDRETFRADALSILTGLLSAGWQEILQTHTDIFIESIKNGRLGRTGLENACLRKQTDAQKNSSCATTIYRQGLIRPAAAKLGAGGILWMQAGESPMAVLRLPFGRQYSLRRFSP
ncbi:MAG: hypothetical protein HFE86_06220 [Clostridiales bacterium]|nr:hypothetical protein [Clostridiales bacterium]